MFSRRGVPLSDLCFKSPLVSEQARSHPEEGAPVGAEVCWNKTHLQSDLDEAEECLGPGTGHGLFSPAPGPASPADSPLYPMQVHTETTWV